MADQQESGQSLSLKPPEFLDDLPADAKLTPEQAVQAKAQIDEYFDGAIKHINEQAALAESDLRERILSRAKLLPKGQEFTHQPESGTSAPDEPKPN